MEKPPHCRIACKGESMSPIVAMYLGFIVAVVIVVWAVLLLVQRIRKQQKAQRRALYTLVPFKPTVAAPSAEAVDDEDVDDEEMRVNHHSPAQQNGHYLGSKKHP